LNLIKDNNMKEKLNNFQKELMILKIQTEK